MFKQYLKSEQTDRQTIVPADQLLPRKIREIVTVDSQSLSIIGVKKQTLNQKIVRLNINFQVLGTPNNDIFKSSILVFCSAAIGPTQLERISEIEQKAKDILLPPPSSFPYQDQSIIKSTYELNKALFLLKWKSRGILYFV